MDRIDKCVEAVVCKWRDLQLSLWGPKWHAVEKHLVFLMRKWHDIGCFTEDHIEQSHQTGMLEERKTGHMSDRLRAAFSHSREEWKRVMEPLIKSEGIRVKNETTRKRGSKRSSESSLREENELRKKNKRNAIRDNVLDTVLLDPDPVPNDNLVDNVVVIDDDDDDDRDDDDNDGDVDGDSMMV